MVGPHDDALVMTLDVSNCEVARILIDNSSSIDVIFRSTMKTMNIGNAAIERDSTDLIRFNGATISSLQMLKLPFKLRA